MVSYTLSLICTLANTSSATPIADLADAKLGVEATAYLQLLIDQPTSHEPLLAALGGEPNSLRQHIEDELDNWKQFNITPLFVFDGQSTVGNDEMAMRRAKASLVKMQKAWSLYAENHAEDAVKTFGAAGMAEYSFVAGPTDDI